MNTKTVDGYTPSMIACVYKKPDVLKLLLKYGGADFNTTNSKNQSIEKICEIKDAYICRTLLEDYKPNLVAGIVPLNCELLDKV